MSLRGIELRALHLPGHHSYPCTSSQPIQFLAEIYPSTHPLEFAMLIGAAALREYYKVHTCISHSHVAWETQLKVVWT